MAGGAEWLAGEVGACVDDAAAESALTMVWMPVTGVAGGRRQSSRKIWVLMMKLYGRKERVACGTADVGRSEGTGTEGGRG